MADTTTCGSSCTGGCEGSCSGSCEGKCSGSCKGGCSGCSGCSGCTSCSGSCEGTCCTFCRNACVSACASTCNSTCKGNCFETCKDSCYESCSGQCKGYCAEICQSYCETEQTFSLNSIGKGTFSWTNPVAQNLTIKITASDWNKLKSYIKAATNYCGGTTPTSANVKTLDPITADDYNDLADGIDVSNVVKNKTLITADNIDLLRTTYNDRQIKSNLPNGSYNNSAGPDECCQSGEICMSSGQLLSHQVKTEACADQSESPCGGQSPGR